MDQNRLATLLEKPEIQRRILRDYHGGYSLGLIRHPRKKQELAIRIRVESEDASRFPAEIVLDGESVPIIVSTSFRLPEPLGNQA